MKQGLRQGCMLASLVFSIFFAAVGNVACTRSKADKYVMDALVQLKTRTGTGGWGEATAGEPAVAMLV